MTALKWNPVDAQGIDPNRALTNFSQFMQGAADATQRLVDNEQRNNALVQNQLEKQNASLSEYMKSQERPFDYAGAQNIWNILREGGYSSEEILSNPQVMGILNVRDKDAMSFLNDVDKQFTTNRNAHFSNMESSLNAQRDEALKYLETQKAYLDPEQYTKDVAAINSQHSTEMNKLKARRIPTRDPNVDAYTYFLNRGQAPKTIEEKATTFPEVATSTGSAKEKVLGVIRPTDTKYASLESPSNAGFLRVDISNPQAPVVIDRSGKPFEKVNPEIVADVTKYGQMFNVSPEFLLTKIGQESGFDTNAVSKQGARGLAQMFPDAVSDVMTHYGNEWRQEFGDAVPDPHNPKHAAFMGAAYTAVLTEQQGVRNDPLDIYLAYNLGATGSSALREALNNPRIDSSMTLEELGLYNDSMKKNPGLYVKNETLAQTRKRVENFMGLKETELDPSTLWKASQPATDKTQATLAAETQGSIPTPGGSEVPLEAVMKMGSDATGSAFIPIAIDDKGNIVQGNVEQNFAALTRAKGLVAKQADYSTGRDVEPSKITDKQVASFISSKEYVDYTDKEKDNITAMRKEIVERLGGVSVSEEELIELLNSSISNGDGTGWIWDDAPSVRKEVLDAKIKVLKEKKATHKKIYDESLPVIESLNRDIPLLAAALETQKKLAEGAGRMDQGIDDRTRALYMRQIERNNNDITRLGMQVNLNAGKLAYASNARLMANASAADAKVKSEVDEDQDSTLNKILGVFKSPYATEDEATAGRLDSFAQSAVSGSRHPANIGAGLASAARRNTTIQRISELEAEYEKAKEAAAVEGTAAAREASKAAKDALDSFKKEMKAADRQRMFNGLTGYGAGYVPTDGLRDYKSSAVTRFVRDKGKDSTLKKPEVSNKLRDYLKSRGIKNLTEQQLRDFVDALEKESGTTGSSSLDAFLDRHK